MVLVIATAVGATVARADQDLRFPSPEIPDEAALRELLTTRPTFGTPALAVTFARGTHAFSSPLEIRRDDVTLRGEGRGANAATLTSDADAVIAARGAARIEIRGLRLRATATAATPLALRATLPSGGRSFVSDVRVAHCVLEGSTGLTATSGVEGVSVVACKVVVTRPAGRGIVWEDGSALVVSRTTVTTVDGVEGDAAIVVRGAADATSDGRRARRIIVTRNRVKGDFASGIVVRDAVDVRISKNRIVFSSPLRAAGGAREGIVVERVAATGATEDFEVVSNVLRRVHTAMRLSDVGGGAVARNRMASCASPARDTLFGDTGCAVRILVNGARCASGLRIFRNDFRGLRSPKGDFSVITTPTAAARSCVVSADNNRVDPRHPLFEGVQ